MIPSPKAERPWLVTQGEPGANWIETAGLLGNRSRGDPTGLTQGDAVAALIGSSSGVIAGAVVPGSCPLRPE